jgi:1,2-diacylglycerol 3-alpha-glucosyltransferase
MNHGSQRGHAGPRVTSCEPAMPSERSPGAAGASYRLVMVAASPFPYPQGSQVLISQLAAALRRRGHRVDIVAYPRGSGQPPREVRIHRVPEVPGLGLTRPGPSWRKLLLDLLLARALLRVVRCSRPDLIHTHNFEGLLIALFVRKLTGVPVIHHVHNAMGLELHTYFRSRLGRWAGGVVGHWVDAHLPRRADRCILLNEAAVTYFQQRGVKHFDVVPPGIDFEPGEARRVRQELGQGALVLYSGNLDRYQDLGLLVEAFRRLAGSSPGSRLVFSTNGNSKECRTQADTMGLGSQVLFLPADDFDAVRDLFAAADVAVCPRRACLGFPIKLLNYMAAGKAIVVSAGSACGLRHLQDGWIVVNGDAAGMATAISTLLHDRDLARRLGENARAMARSEYTWDRAVDAIEEIYGQIVGQREDVSHPRGRQP